MKIISVAGVKNSGKTTLIERLIKELNKYGRVGTLKHMHGHELNPEDTDTRRHVDAGAAVVVGVTPSGTVKFTSRLGLGPALNELADSGMDYAVIEGFKDSRVPKIVLGDLELPNMILKLSSHPADLTEEAVSDLITLIDRQPEYHTLGSLIAKVKQNPRIKEAGAIGSFTGIVRQKTDDMETRGLDFESYEGITGSKIQEIEEDLMARDGIVDVMIHHNTGWIGPGEDIVYIVVAASHRQQLFPALSDAIERVKAEVPIWKKEYTADGEFWVHNHP